MSTVNVTPAIETAAIEIFRDCMTRVPEPEWGQFVREKCEDQPEVGRRLASMLRFHTSDSSWLTGTALSGSSIDSFNAKIPKPGDTLGEYRVISLLGQGTASTLLHAEGPTGPVAIKFPIARIAIESSLQRFRNECELHKGLSHPNICCVMEVNELHSSLPMLVLEFIDGLDLKEACIKYNFGTVEKMDLLLQLSSAMRYLHNSGYVHGDVKAENVMVKASESRLVCKLIDFGKAEDFLVLRSPASGHCQSDTNNTVSPKKTRKSREQGEFRKACAKDENDFAWLRNFILTL
ncbi:MAG: hypothetical protein CMM01_26665 [Rhodopirellula sp.]|nr:hypothetical protein [Rhodopirellula sp.]